MINFAVINLKKLIKNLIKISFIFAFAFGIINIREIISFKFDYFGILKDSFGFEEKQEKPSEDFFQTTVVKEIAISEIKVASLNEEKAVPQNQEESEEKNIAQEEISSNDEVKVDENIDNSVPHNLKTTVISENNLAENYNTTYKSVKIKNETKFDLTEDVLTPNVQITDNKNIIIFHTHTCESYTPTEANSYVASGNYRTIDLNHSVARVGTVLQTYLNSKGFNVIHDMNYHDYPAYNGSYDRSFNTVKGLLDKNPTTQFVIDLHRDAVRKYE